MKFHKSFISTSQIVIFQILNDLVLKQLAVWKSITIHFVPHFIHQLKRKHVLPEQNIVEYQLNKNKNCGNVI